MKSLLYGPSKDLNFAQNQRVGVSGFDLNISACHDSSRDINVVLINNNPILHCTVCVLLVTSWTDENLKLIEPCNLRVSWRSPDAHPGDVHYVPQVNHPPMLSIVRVVAAIAGVLYVKCNTVHCSVAGGKI